MVKYRLIKRTYASGFVSWIIEKRGFLWLWEYVDSYFDKAKALEVLGKLRDGLPERTNEVVA